MPFLTFLYAFDLFVKFKTVSLRVILAAFEAFPGTEPKFPMIYITAVSREANVPSDLHQTLCFCTIV